MVATTVNKREKRNHSSCQSVKSLSKKGLLLTHKQIMGAVVGKNSKKRSVRFKTKAIIAFSKEPKRKEDNTKEHQDKAETMEQKKMKHNYISLIIQSRQKLENYSELNNNKNMDTCFEQEKRSPDVLLETGRHRNTAVVIQSTFRSYYARKEIEEQREAALVIQRKLRQNTEHKAKLKKGKKFASVPEGHKISLRTENDITTENYSKPSTCSEISMKTKDNLASLQNDIVGLRWRGEQQSERNNMENGVYVPQIILLIASNIPRNDLLAKIHIPGVHALDTILMSNSLMVS